jgi:hypothetical protein
MKKHELLKNEFNWVPKDQRSGRFGASPPRKPEFRRPLLWLARAGGDLYLVNASGGTLDSVIADMGGFTTADDGVVAVSSNENYEYTNIENGDAVKVDEYDDYYDLDYLLQVVLRVQSPQFGILEILSPIEKGGVGETVLLWDSGERGKHVGIKQLQASSFEFAPDAD